MSHNNDYRFLDDPDFHARKFIDLLYDDDELIGLFVLGATFPSSKCPCGFYFNRETFFEHVDELNRQGNLYINLNELHHDLYGRGADTLKTFAERRYSDAEVVRRKRLLIDCDPERLPGINSTDEELQLAIEKAKQVAAFLEEQWGVEPVLLISGNGAQLLYRIDEPSESDLVAGVLESLSERFSDDKVHVDTAVSDAARITRLPGTVNMKGDDIPDRPQRYAQILSAPEEVKVVTTEQLSGLLPDPVNNTTASSPIHPVLSDCSKGGWTHEQIEELLDNEYRAFEGHGWDYKVVDHKEHGVMYKLRQCPFVEHHVEYRAAVWLNNGVPCYKCFSDDCDGDNKKTFGDFLRKIAPERLDGRPEVLVSTNERTTVDQAVASLAHATGVYQRAGKLVRIERNPEPPRGLKRDPDAPSIGNLPKPTLREVLTHVGKWLKPTKNDLVATHPPTWAVDAVFARGEWPTPPLLAIAGTPFLRADGTIADQPGYDALTGVYCDFKDKIDKLPDPEQAAQDLRELVCDFPFESEAHAAAWIAGLLTPLAAHAFSGPSPLFLADANSPGSGKSLLMDLMSLIVNGHVIARMSAPGADDEWRKRITSIAISGEPLVLIDNIEGQLGSAALDAALTSETWSDRLLGGNKMVTLPLVSTWYATGNNVMLARDTTRRTLHIRLNTTEEKPEERTDFKVADIVSHVRRERMRYVANALSILSGYCEAGRPDMGLSPWGSFQGWSDLVRSSIRWAGLTDPGETRIGLAARADTDSDNLRMLHQAMQKMDPNGEGLTVAEVMKRIDDPDAEELRTVLDVLPGRDRKSSLVAALQKYRERVLGGRMIDNEKRGNVNAWYVLSA